MTDPPAAGRQLVLDRRRDQLETDIKSALNFLHGTDLVVRLLQAADSYAGKCCEAATAADPTTETEGFRAYKAGRAAGRTEGAAAERERIRQGIATMAREPWSGNGYMWPDHLAALLEGTP